jgi:hypothetical protein
MFRVQRYGVCARRCKPPMGKRWLHPTETYLK